MRGHPAHAPAILVVHFAHILAATLETLTLGILMLRGPVEKKQYGDITINAAYWYFVVLAWLPVYAIIYWVPRWI